MSWSLSRFPSGDAPIQEGQEKGLEQQRCPVDQEEQVCGSHRE